jgi:hypothetical protein
MNRCFVLNVWVQINSKDEIFLSGQNIIKTLLRNNYCCPHDSLVVLVPDYNHDGLQFTNIFYRLYLFENNGVQEDGGSLTCWGD